MNFNKTNSLSLDQYPPSFSYTLTLTLGRRLIAIGYTYIYTLPHISEGTWTLTSLKLKYNLIVTDEKLKDYRLLAKHFRSAKFTSKDMTDEFKANPEFKDWYFKNYIGLEK